MTADPPDKGLPGKVAGGRPHRSNARLDEVFGDVLPASTRDDLDGAERGGSGLDGSLTRRGADATRDDELLRDVPPHHR